MSLPWLQYWPRLKAALTRPATIPNWTKDGGEVGDNFEAYAKGDYVVVTLPNGRVRNIYFGEMEAVYNVWEGYLSGKVPRSRIAHAMKIFNSKYIISIFRKFQHMM